MSGISTSGFHKTRKDAGTGNGGGHGEFARYLFGVPTSIVGKQRHQINIRELLRGICLYDDAMMVVGDK